MTAPAARLLAAADLLDKRAGDVDSYVATQMRGESYRITRGHVSWIPDPSLLRLADLLLAGES